MEVKGSGCGLLGDGFNFGGKENVYGHREQCKSGIGEQDNLFPTERVRNNVTKRWTPWKEKRGTW